jgi:hypothetical protein
MAELDFPNNPTVGQRFTGTNGALYEWDGNVWIIATIQPGGTAGGDLTGSYPNPQIAPLAIVDADVHDVSWAKITGAPGATWIAGAATFIHPADTTVNLSLPLGKKITFTNTPLSGPHPEIRSDTNGGIVVSADIGSQAVMSCGNSGASILVNPTQVQAYHDLQVFNGGILPGLWAETPVAGAIQVTAAGILQAYSGTAWQNILGQSGGGGAPTGPAGGVLSGTYPNPQFAAGLSTPPSGPAGGSLSGTYPAPIIANQAITLPMMFPGVIPTTLPPSGAAGGDLSGTYPNPALGVVQGANVKLKAHGSFFSGPGGASLAVNDGNHDDVFTSASPSWALSLSYQLGGDSAAIMRRPSGGPVGAYTALLTVNPDGTIRATVNPSNALDLTTKQYVDSKSAGGAWTDNPANNVLLPAPTTRSLQLTDAGLVYFGNPLAGAPAVGSKGGGDLYLHAQDGTFITFDVGGASYGTWNGDGLLVATALSVNGLITTADGVQLGQAFTPRAGVIQWNGTHFQGYNGTAWVNLD